MTTRTAVGVPTPAAGNVTLFFENKTLKGKDDTGLVTDFAASPFPSWYGNIYGVNNTCDPGELLELIRPGGFVPPTPTNITITLARIAYFRPPANITVNKIRFYGVGVTTNIYRVAIYNADTLARLMPETALSTVAGVFGAAGAGLNLTLTAGQLYFLAVSVNAVGATAGIASMGINNSATAGQIAVLPKSYPGNLDADLGYVKSGYAQFTVVAGALPVTAPVIAAQGLWTGGFPAFWLDNSNL